MKSEIFVGKDFNLLSQLLSAPEVGSEDVKTRYYKFLLIRDEVTAIQKLKKPEVKTSLLLFTPASLGIKLLDLNTKSGYWCLIPERSFIQYTLLKLITVSPLFSNDTDQLNLEKSDHVFEPLFKIMLRESESGGSHKYDAIYNCIALMLLEAIKRLPAKSYENEFNAAVGLFQAFLFLLDERIRRSADGNIATLDPEYFSALLIVDPDYLSQVIYKISGKDIHQLINEQLIQKANILLSSSDNSVKEIAAMLGFDSTGQFQQLYKKSMGITPLNFRKDHRSFL
jgi:AraC-like DNA-binding protein